MKAHYLLIFFCVGLLLVGMDCSNQVTPSFQTRLEERFHPDSQSYAFVIPHLEPVAGVDGVTAKHCSKCHKEIYKEWKMSTHATALRDIQFQAELAKEDSPKWICLNCHIPIQNQRDYIITHLEDNDIMRPIKKPNPNFDYNMQQEAITCATCHIRSDESGNSYIIGAIGSPLAPHPVKKDKQFLRDICLRCHNPQGEGLTKNLICWFETKKEMEEAQPNIKEKFGKKLDCVDCHMPEKKRLITTYPSIPKRISHQHHWVGSGIPKWYDSYDSLLHRGYVQGLETKVSKISTIRPNEKMSVEIKLNNAQSGHYLPTADPERFILVSAEIVDNLGNQLERKTHRIGQTWEWSPARKIGDNRLKQNESFSWNPTFSMPSELKGLKLLVTVIHVRLSAKNAISMKETKNINEDLFKNGTHFIKNIKDYYPFATYLFKEEISLNSIEKRIWSQKELIELSKMEQGKPLSSRAY